MADNIGFWEPWHVHRGIHIPPTCTYICTVSIWHWKSHALQQKKVIKEGFAVGLWTRLKFLVWTKWSPKFVSPNAWCMWCMWSALPVPYSLSSHWWDWHRNIDQYMCAVCVWNCCSFFWVLQCGHWKSSKSMELCFHRSSSNLHLHCSRLDISILNIIKNQIVESDTAEMKF